MRDEFISLDYLQPHNAVVCAVETESLYLWRRDKRDANKWTETSTRELENQNIVAIASLCQRDRQISPKHFRVSVGQC